jgi:hypothetical protein
MKILLTLSALALVGVVALIVREKPKDKDWEPLNSDQDSTHNPFVS